MQLGTEGKELVPIARKCLGNKGAGAWSGSAMSTVDEKGRPEGQGTTWILLELDDWPNGGKIEVAQEFQKRERTSSEFQRIV